MGGENAVEVKAREGGNAGQVCQVELVLEMIPDMVDYPVDSRRVFSSAQSMLPDDESSVFMEKMLLQIFLAQSGCR